MKFENVIEMLEKLGFEYVEDSDSGDKIVFSNGEKYVIFDENDENNWEVK